MGRLDVRIGRRAFQLSRAADSAVAQRRFWLGRETFERSEKKRALSGGDS
jgi:hypothetical protein